VDGVRSILGCDRVKRAAFCDEEGEQEEKQMTTGSFASYRACHQYIYDQCAFMQSSI